MSSRRAFRAEWIDRISLWARFVRILAWWVLGFVAILVTAEWIRINTTDPTVDTAEGFRVKRWQEQERKRDWLRQLQGGEIRSDHWPYPCHWCEGTGRYCDSPCGACFGFGSGPR